MAEHMLSMHETLGSIPSISIFRASLMAQLVKNLPTMRETWVQSLGWEDPLEKGKVKSQIRLSDFHFHFSAKNLER